MWFNNISFKPINTASIWWLIILLIIVSLICSYFVKEYFQEKIAIKRLAAISVLVCYLAFVFWNTVINRQTGIRRLELHFLWSYKEIFSGNIDMLNEVLLNFLMLFPVGMLIPIVLSNSRSYKDGFMCGGIISIIIEIMQLVLCRGFFEFDDILHNSIGCMLGYIFYKHILKKVVSNVKRFNIGKYRTK